jgi:hypothetical protein
MRCNALAKSDSHVARNSVRFALVCDLTLTPAACFYVKCIIPLSFVHASLSTSSSLDNASVEPWIRVR